MLRICQSRTACPDTPGSQPHRPNFAKEFALPTQDKTDFNSESLRDQRFKKIKKQADRNHTSTQHQFPFGATTWWLKRQETASI